MDYTAARRDRLARLLPDEGVDAFLISNPVNVTYLTGFTGDSSTVVLTRDRVILVSDPRYVGQIADECPELETHIRKPTTRICRGLRRCAEEARLPIRRLRERRRHRGRVRVISRSWAPAVAWKAAADRVEQLRMVKDADELARIRDAIAVAERAFTALVALLRPEDTEIELANALEANIRRAGGEGASFPPIVAVGERAALPHCPPTDRRVSTSGLLLVDWGASGPRLQKRLDSGSGDPYKIVFRAIRCGRGQTGRHSSHRSGGSGSGRPGRRGRASKRRQWTRRPAA